VGADTAAGAPHRVRLFSGNGEIDERIHLRGIGARGGGDRMGARGDSNDFPRGPLRPGRGPHPFYKAGLPAVRFTEPLKTTIISIKRRGRKMGLNTEIWRNI